MHDLYAWIKGWEITPSRSWTALRGGHRSPSGIESLEIELPKQPLERECIGSRDMGGGSECSIRSIQVNVSRRHTVTIGESIDHGAIEFLNRLNRSKL